MENDSNDEADLLAAIDAFCVTDAGSDSDSDDDGVSSVDTSAVALILAARRSCDAAGFGALAEALSAAATSSCPAVSEVMCSEIQVRPRVACRGCRSRFCQQMRAARVVALEASLSDCKLLVSSVADSTDRSCTEFLAVASDAALSACELQRMQVRATSRTDSHESTHALDQERNAQKEAEQRRAVERQQQRQQRAHALQQQQDAAEARAVELQRRQAELAAAAAVKREEEERQRQQMQLWMAEQAAAAALVAAAAEANERRETERLKEERSALHDKMQQLADAEEHRAETRQQVQEQQAQRIDELRAGPLPRARFETQFI